MNKKIVLLFVSVFLAGKPAAFAQVNAVVPESLNELVDKVTISEEDPETGALSPILQNHQVLNSMSNRRAARIEQQLHSENILSDSVITGDPQIDAVIRVGAQVWKVIEKNAAVATAKNETVSALPKDSLKWQSLTGWRPMNNLIVEHEFTNLFGMSVAKIKYRVSALTNGTYRNVGQYVANASVTAVDVQAMWGYTVYVTARSGTVLNLGTENNPIAFLQLDVDWGVKTLLRSILHTDSFQARGNGSLTKVNDQ